MIAVVTGSRGFIGRNLVDRLLRDGHTVRRLVRRDREALPADGQSFVVDYDTPSTLLELPALDGADVVFHLAGATRAVRADEFHAANVIPARHLLCALTARRLQPRFVFVSSQAAAGPAASLARPTDESDPPRPVEAYGRSKLEAERVVSGFNDHLPTTIVRPSAVFGPYDRDFLPLFRAAQLGWIVYPAVREHWMSLLHVADLVDALMAAALSSRSVGRTYFLGSSEPVQWRAVGAAIARAVGRPIREVDLPRTLVGAAALAGDVVGRVTRRRLLANRSKAALSLHPFWVCSASRARGDLDLGESRALPAAVAETYLWYHSNGWLGRAAGSR
jgi:nucleoside-diphosphate-sugar epimerase